MKQLFIFLILALSLFGSSIVYAQCPVTAFASPTTVQCGDPISLTAIAQGCKPLNNNFNSGDIGTDWQATTGAVVTNGTNSPSATYACVGPPPEGSHCLWMGATVAAPREVKTKSYDLTQCSATGGNICFFMKFATQGNADPCEGIDLPEEGVAVEYSINGGTSWVMIQYFDPNGGFDSVRTAWTKYCLNIPAAAMTTATQFRWRQTNSSGAGFDTWGLDDMVINLISPGHTFDWAHDAQAPDALPNTPDVIGVQNTSFTVTYTNGVETCSSSVAVTVIGTTGTTTATPVNLCAGQTSQLDVNASLIPPIPTVCGQSITGCQGTSTMLNYQTGNVTETSAMLLGRSTSVGGVISVSNCFTGSTEISNYDVVGRFQFIINKNELPAYFQGGQLYRLELFPIGNPGAYNNVTISIGCTNNDEFASNTDFIGGLTTVFNGPLNFSGPSTMIDFQNHYDWPGGTNIVVQVCWKHPSQKTGNLFKQTTTNFSSIFSHSCSGTQNCNTVVASTRFQFRPDFKLGICYRPIPVLNYSWSPAATLTNPNIKNPVATVNTTTTYTVTVSDPAKPAGCNLVQNVTVNVVKPTVSITPANPNICSSGGNVSLTANALPSMTGGTIVSYSWSPAAGLSASNTKTVTANPTATTTYTVTVVDNMGCSSTATVTVTVGQPAGPAAVNGERCGTGSVSLAVTGCGGTVNWYAAPTGGTSLFTGNPFNTPSISSTTTYYASCTVTGCESTRTAVVATINSAPNAGFSYNPSTQCQTGTNVVPTMTGTPGTFTASPTGLTINSSTGEVTPSSSTAGAYTVTNSVAATPGCPATSATSSITITAPPKANFQYVGSPYCQNAANPTPNFVSGGQAGTFSSTTGLVFVNTSTGQINIAASTPGTYTITNTIAAANGCAPVTFTFDITINAMSGSAFSYASSSYCITGTNPSPTITGSPGGTFTSSPSGLSINSASGLIDLALSTIGSYTITYTTTGACPTSSTFNLSVTGSPVATFHYANSPYCQSSSDPFPTFTGGGTAGTFTSTPAGLVFISTSTGQVDVSASTPGTYDVTNTVTATGCANAVAISSITITAPRSGNFTYSQPSYCQSETDPTANLFPGAFAGTFTASPAGLSFLTSNGTIDLSASAAGSYIISNTLAAQGGCPSQSFDTNVSINANTTATFNYASGTYCTSGTNPTPTITGNGGGTFTSSPAGLAFANTSNGTINLGGSTPGNYTITYSVGGACPSSTSVPMTLSSSAQADFAYAGPYCLNDPDPTPTFTNGGTAGTFSSTAGLVFANSGSGLIDLSASTPGTYTVTNTIGSASGCPPVSFNNTITLTPTDNPAFNYSASSFCETSVTATPTVTGTPGGNFTSTGALVFSNPANGTIDLMATPQGAYTIQYTTTGSCASSSSVLVEIFHQNSPEFDFAGSPYCATAGTATPSYPTGGIAGNFSIVSGSAIFQNQSIGSINLSSSGAGTSVVRNTLPANGACPAVFHDENITITAPSNANFSYPNNPYCLSGPNPTVQLAPGAVAGVFSKTNPNVTIQNTSTGEIDLLSSLAGSYTITNSVAANAGCPAVSDTATVTISQPATSSFSYPSSPYCQAGSNATVQLNAGASAGTFSCSNPSLVLNSTNGTVDVANSNVGTYTVTNTFNPANGCPVSTSNASITISSAVSADFDYGTSYCQNASNPTPTFINNGAAGTFSSTAGLVFVSTSTGQINLAASAPGTYTITNTIPANGGCAGDVYTDNVTISSVDNATIAYSQAQYCAQGTDPTPVITGTTGGNFTFSPNGLSINPSTGTIDLDLSIQTLYTITYTTTGACPDNHSVNVDIVNAPSADFNYNPDVYCQTDTDPSPIFVNGGSAGTFSAAPTGLVFVSTSTGQIDLSATQAGNYNVTNSIAAANGCPAASFTTTVSINSIPDAEFYYAQTEFCNDEADIAVSHNSGVDGTYSAVPMGLVINSTSGLIDISASSPNTYQVRNVVMGTGNCPNDTNYFSIRIKPMPTVVPASNSPICEGQDLNLTVQTAPNLPGTTFSWSGPAAYTSNVQNPIRVDAFPDYSGSYTVQITTEGCTSFSILNGVLVNPNAPTNFGPHGPYCPDEPVTNLTASDAGGTWSGVGILDPNNGTFDPAIGTGTYKVHYQDTDPSNCILDSVEVIVKEMPQASLSVFPQTGCVPLDVQFQPLGNNAGDVLTWNFGNGISSNVSNPNYTYTVPGCFDVSLTINRNGCISTFTEPQAVCAIAQANASFTVDPKKADITFANFTFTNTSQTANEAYWTFGDETFSTAINPVHLYKDVKAGEYQVMLIASNDGLCSDTAYETIEITESLLFFIPNTFTPDADKFNQIFMPVMTSGFSKEDYNFVVFNRWGEVVFETNNHEEGWDGTYQNQLCPDGIYTWKISFSENKTGNRLIKTGMVNLMK